MESFITEVLEMAKNLLEIDSPSGYTKNAAMYMMESYKKLGFHPVMTKKGGILVDIGEHITGPAILLEAHIDTLGAMVTELKDNGAVKITPIGGMNANNAEAENVRVRTRTNKVYEGTFQLNNASIHVNGDYNEKKRNFDEMEVVLDEVAASKGDLEKLGIMPGDIVCFEPRFRITDSGYIKSRFLDDKLSAAILLGFASYIAKNPDALKCKVYQYLTVYEEVGHGGSASIPSDVEEVISVDMGCVGAGLGCNERKVSVCAKDSRGPYNYEVVGQLIEAAQKLKLDYSVDIYPHYGSDADAALTAGFDVRHGLIGPGVYASHGYERSHKAGVLNTLMLLKGYLTKEN